MKSSNAIAMFKNLHLIKHNWLLWVFESLSEPSVDWCLERVPPSVHPLLHWVITMVLECERVNSYIVSFGDSGRYDVECSLWRLASYHSGRKLARNSTQLSYRWDSFVHSERSSRVPSSRVSFSLHSFIHSYLSNIYIAPLQEKLLRGAPNSSAAKKNSLQTRKERER